MSEPKEIRGQVIYRGPMIPHLGLQRGAIFRNGIHPQIYPAIAQCPALGELFLTPKESAVADRQMNFDIARNMRGTKGKYVTFYNQVQQWLAGRTANRSTSPQTTVRS